MKRLYPAPGPALRAPARDQNGRSVLGFTAANLAVEPVGRCPQRRDAGGDQGGHGEKSREHEDKAHQSDGDDAGEYGAHAVHHSNVGKGLLMRHGALLKLPA